MEDPDPSVQDWRNHLLNSLKGTGRLNTLKSQLRAQLVDQLRDHDGALLEYKGNRKPSLTERILTSLFLDYLKAHGFSFTQSVFLPESQAGSWPPFTFQELAQLLHLDKTTSSHLYLKIGPREKGCLAQQLVMVLQQLPFRSGTQDSSTQTTHPDPRDLDGCLREIDDICFQNKASESRMTFRTIEERLNTFRQEFETRVNAEVALQVTRIREFETSTVRVEEEGRYRRQLAREREELEQIHKTRLERIREREESVMEQLVMKEKAIDTSAYEQRQKLLTSITDLRDREERVKDKEDQQKRLEDAFEERDRLLRVKEADVAQREATKATIHAQAESDAQMKIKDLEEQFRRCQEQLQSERNLLEAERGAREDKTRLGNELTAVKSGRDLVHSLNERLASDEKRRMELVNSLLERLASEEQRNLSLKTIEEFHLRAPPNGTPTAKSSLPDTGNPLQNDRSENANDLWEDRTLGKCSKICQQQHRRWARDQKKAQETIRQLEKAIQEAEDRKERAQQSRRAVQLQLKSSDSELLETVSLLKKTQHALELERLHHYSLRSQIATVFSVPRYALTTEARSKPRCGSVPAMEDVGAAKYIEGDREQSLGHDQMISGHSPVSNNATPSTHQTKSKLRDLSPTKTDPVGIAWTHQKEGLFCSDITSETSSSATEQHRGMVDRNPSRVPRQLDDVAVIDGSGKEPFRQGRTEAVDSGSSDSSRCASGINMKTTSEKQISNQTARSRRDYEPLKSSCHQNSSGTDSLASTEASRVPVKSTPSPSGLEAKRTASADCQATSQRRTKDDVLGTHSTKRSSFSEPTPVNWKTIKHPSYSDNPTEARVQINNDPVEKMRFQKHVQRSRSSDSEGHQGDQGDQGDEQNESSSAHPHPQEHCDKVSEVYSASKFSGRRGSHTSTPTPTPRKRLLNLDTVESQKSIIAHKDELQKGGIIIRPGVEIKRPLGDEALHKLTCLSPQNEVRPCTFDNEPHTPVQRIANDEEKCEEKEDPTHAEPKTISNPANSPEGVKRESSTSEQSKPAGSAGNPKCDLRQWLTDKICMDLDFCDQANSFEQIDGQQHDTEAMPHAGAERKRGDEGFRMMSASGPSDDSEVLHRETREQLGSGNISITQYLVELQAQCKQSGSSSSTSKTSASELVESVKQTDGVIVGEGASSEESSSNPVKRASSVQNTREVVFRIPLQLLEDAPDETDSRQDQGQTGDDEDSAAGASSRVQSQQGSYSPGDVEWIDDFPTSANANYLDNSDAFDSDTFSSDVPKSDLCRSGSQSSK